MTNRIRLMRALGLTVAVASVVASVRSVAHGDITVWVSATSPHNDGTFDVEAAGNTPSTASAIMIGSTRTTWDPQIQWWFPPISPMGFTMPGTCS
jgi:hypothetical protein